MVFCLWLVVSLSSFESFSPLFFFFNDTATTEIYTLSLHDALPILTSRRGRSGLARRDVSTPPRNRDRKSTRLNSSHDQISYAVFCLKKKNATALSPFIRLSKFSAFSTAIMIWPR